jgi:phenylacetate-CoA ligase
LQLSLLAEVLLYRRKFKKAGIHPEDIRCYDDLVKVPFSEKRDIVRDYKGAIADKNISVYHTTSGTSGLPTVVGFTKNDVDLQISLMMKDLRMIGVKEDDIVHNNHTIRDVLRWNRPSRGD